MRTAQIEQNESAYLRNIRHSSEQPLLPATDERPSTVKVIIPLTDPEIVGRFVYHCHAVDHEDKGMMGTVLVTV